MEYRFEKLDVWPIARWLVKEVYEITKEFPRDELFALTNQIRRAIVSVTSNIVEGSAKHSEKEQMKFYETSFASLMESYSQLLLAVDLGYIHITKVDNIKPLIDRVAAMLSGLRNSCLKKIESKSQI